MKCRVQMADLSDLATVASLRAALWPEGSVDEHEVETISLVALTRAGRMPGYRR